MKECMNQWTSEWMREWMNQWTSDRMSEWENEWIGEQVAEWVKNGERIILSHEQVQNDWQKG